MFPSLIIHAKLIGNLILIKYLMMDVSLVESVDIDKILTINASFAVYMLTNTVYKEHLCTKKFC